MKKSWMNYETKFDVRIFALIIGLMLWAIFAMAADGASTNLNYSVAEINAGIGYGLANSNKVDTVAATVAAMETNLNSGVAYVAFPGTQIESSWNNSSYTDIDLSSYVGTNSALVTLYVSNLEASNNDVLFRANGAGDIGDLDGTTSCQIDASENAYFQVPTSSAGVIEAKTDYAISITLVCYIRANTFEE
jgi:hypothetical protein